MTATPKQADDDGKCKAELYIGDDYADNCATMHCEQPAGHAGEHLESFSRDGSLVTVRWQVDERSECELCKTRVTRDDCLACYGCFIDLCCGCATKVGIDNYCPSCAKKPHKDSTDEA